MSAQKIEKLCIIAGKGLLPEKIAEQNKNCFVIALKDSANENFVKNYNHCWVTVGEVGKILSLMQHYGITHVVLAGAVTKPDFLSLKVDKVGALLLAKITKNKILGDDNILNTVSNFIESKGFRIIGAHELLSDLISEKGVLTTRKPDSKTLNDIEIGKKLLATISSFDIGQSSVIYNGIVLGIEAIEGTDELIKRCGNFIKTEGGVLIKLPKLNQNKKVDLPTIGLQTIKNIADVKIRGIAIKAKETLIIEKESVIEKANQLQQFIIAI